MLPSTAITLGTCFVSVLLLVTLFLRVGAVLHQQRAAKHRSKSAGTCDVLNYGRAIEDGVVLNKDGSLTASWIYTGPDNSCTTAAERNALASRINQALAGFGNGWMVQVDAVRKVAPRYTPRENCHFTDPICAAIDEERRQLFERIGALYEGFFVLTLTYFPPSLAKRRFLELMIEDESRGIGRSDRTAAILADFRNGCTKSESDLKETFHLQRLRRWEVTTQQGAVQLHDEQLRWLHYCITGLNHPIVLPQQRALFLDGLIGGQDFRGGFTPMIGAQHIRVVSIEGFPSESYPGILALLSELPYEYRWSTRFIFMDQHEAEAHLEKYRKKWRQKVVGFFDKLFKTNTGVVDRDALAMVDDAERGIAEIKSGQTAHGYYTSVIVVMDNNCQRADAHALEIYEAVNTIGFAARIETVNAVEAYLGSLPAHSAENIRRPFVSTDNLSHLMPTSTTWTGSATAPCPHYPPGAPALMHCVTRGSTAFRYNLHDGDLGHTLIFGPTRSGKSVFLATLVAHLRQYKDITVFAFDKGNSLYALTRAIHASTGRQDGLHIRLGDDDSPLAFCPLQFLETKADRAWAMNWIDTILRLNDLQTTPEQRNEIGLAITSMYESSSCSISEFVYTVQDDAIRRALHQYTSDGSAGQLLDAPHDDLALANFTVFEIEELMKMDERYALPVLLYIFRRIERCLKGQPAVVILDEAWLMLGHPVFRSKIKEWLKVFAKANCAVVMATQSLSDAANSGILDVMVESCPNKTFLPNPNARETFALYERMGLNERDVEIIATAKPKRHYYYSSPLGKRLFELALGDVALSFVAQSDKETISEIRQLEERYGDDWVNAWLQQRGLAALEKEMAA